MTYIIIPGQKAVKPTMEKPSYSILHGMSKVIEFNKHLLTLPTYSLHESLKDLPVGTELQDDKVREQYQTHYYGKTWDAISKEEYDSFSKYPHLRRIVLVPIEGKEGKPISEQLREIWNPVNKNVDMMRTETGIKEWERLRDLFQAKTKIPRGEQGLNSLACFIEGYQAAKEESHPSYKGEGEEESWDNILMIVMEQYYKSSGDNKCLRIDDDVVDLFNSFKLKYRITLK